MDYGLGYYGDCNCKSKKSEPNVAVRIQNLQSCSDLSKNCSWDYNLVVGVLGSWRIR